MALFNINPAAIGKQLAATAVGRASQAVAQSMSPKLVQDVQRVLKIGNIVGSTLGVRTGIGALDNILGLSGGSEDTPTPALGGLTLRQARAIHDKLQAARVARKNLFFLRVEDMNPPKLTYQPAAPRVSGIGGLLGAGKATIGAALGTLSAGITNGVSSTIGSIAGSTAGGFAKAMIGGAMGGILGGGAASSISQIALNTFDLMALDVNYGTSLISDQVQVGSSFIDQPKGLNPVELSITTMDDEAGTLKRWFNGKIGQVARPDGTFGLPWEYLVQIEIVHAIPSSDVEGWEAAYRKVMCLRPQSIQVDLSRRDQAAVAELQLVLTQFDSFMGTI